MHHHDRYRRVAILLCRWHAPHFMPSCPWVNSFYSARFFRVRLCACTLDPVTFTPPPGRSPPSSGR